MSSSLKSTGRRKVGSTTKPAQRKAEDIIDVHRHTRLQAIDHDVFLAPLDAPAEPATTLVETAARYRARVTPASDFLIAKFSRRVE
jgi:uncharacterized protein (DUF1778 family)